MGVGRAALFRLATSEPLERVVKAAPGGEAVRPPHGGSRPATSLAAPPRKR